jgi:hypothetical protein
VARQRALGISEAPAAEAPKAKKKAKKD